MIAFPDTSFLCAIYRKQDNSQTAATYAATMKEPLHVTALLSYEFRQSLRLQGRRHSHHPKEGMPLADAQAAWNQFEMDLANGVAVLTPCNFQEVFRRAEELSARHTMSSGYRAFDVLHVATALHLEASEFLTFDAGQRKLAVAENLKVRP
jgi:predicted nucleic acid-binding protein